MAIRVLLVDESEELRNMLKFPLLYLGFEVFEAQDALEAIGMLEHQAVEVVITDWEMPQMSGLELVRTIRQTPRWQTLPVVLLLKESQVHKRNDLLTIGVTDTLVLPNEVRKIAAKIKKAMLA